MQHRGLHTEAARQAVTSRAPDREPSPSHVLTSVVLTSVVLTSVALTSVVLTSVVLTSVVLTSVAQTSDITRCVARRHRLRCTFTAW